MDGEKKKTNAEILEFQGGSLFWGGSLLRDWCGKHTHSKHMWLPPHVPTKSIPI